MLRGAGLNRRLPEWAILAGGTALAVAALFASAGITHWVMDAHRSDVVVRQGPTVYVTQPAGHSPAQRAQPAPAAAGPAHGGGDPSRRAARPDHGESPQGKVRAQRTITAAKALAMLTVTDSGQVGLPVGVYSTRHEWDK